MIKKIVKNRREIVEGVAMVSVLYALVVVHSVRATLNAKNSRAYSNY